MCTEGRRPVRVGGILALLGIVACAGTLTDPERFAVDGSSSPQGGAAACGDVTVALFHPRCALSGCHGATDKTAGLDLESPDPHGRLVGKPAMGGPGVLIDPGRDPQKSVLYLKLTPSPPFGAQMPQTGLKLDGESLDCVAQWISGEPAPALDGGSDAPGGS
jgi:hypothetical protein